MKSQSTESLTPGLWRASCWIALKMNSGNSGWKLAYTEENLGSLAQL